MSSQVPLCSNVPLFSKNQHLPLSAPIPSTEISLKSCVSDNETLKQLVKSVQKIQELLEIAFVPANSEPSDSEFESFSSAAMTSSSKLSSLSTGTNSFLYSSAASSTQSSQPSSTLSGVSSGCRRKLWKKSELIEESICIRFQHGSCKYNADQCENSHLCARCFFSKHGLLVPEHGSDWCQEDFF